jgi:hypothetical protein
LAATCPPGDDSHARRQGAAARNLRDAQRGRPAARPPADWLEEHGDEHDRARAEFIRLQCRLAGLEEYSPEFMDLSDREAELLEDHQERWVKRLPAWVREKFGKAVRLT